MNDVLAPALTAPVLVAGQWRHSNAAASFQAENPTLGEALPESYPVSSWKRSSKQLRPEQRRQRSSTGLPARRSQRFSRRMRRRLRRARMHWPSALIRRLDCRWLRG